MEKTINENRTPNMLKLLKEELKLKSGNKLDSKTDFEDAASWINGKKKLKKDEVKEDTLRNWWYKEEPKHKPYKSKLSLVAQRLGYRNWDSFCDIKSRQTTLNSFFDPLEFKVEKMTLGESYIIGWFPQHYVELNYLGNYKFKIVDCSSDINLKIGDDMEIYGFGIVYLKHMDSVYDNSGKKFEVEGYPLHPSIVIRTDKSVNESIDNNENTSVCIVG